METKEAPQPTVITLHCTVTTCRAPVILRVRQDKIAKDLTPEEQASLAQAELLDCSNESFNHYSNGYLVKLPQKDPAPQLPMP